MAAIQTEIILTLVLIVVLFVLMHLIRVSLNKFTLLRSIDANRRKIIINLINFLLYIPAIIVLALIWGLNLREFAVFISSILAVLGVGFFAQWSILSNLTASVILFFYHPMRIGDRIRVLDKDFDWSGEVKDITGFYLFLKTDKGESITIPNNLAMQKGIEILKAKGEIISEPVIPGEENAE